MKYLIKRGRLYVAKPGRKNSFTNSLAHAQKYDSFDHAKINACDNESVVSLDEVVA